MLGNPKSNPGLEKVAHDLGLGGGGFCRVPV